MIADKCWEDRWGNNADQRPNDPRSPFMRDECRVIHSFAFRRLQGKMQVFGPEKGDFHRTRMTHSLEVASIARGIIQHLRTTALPNLNDEERNHLLRIDANDYDRLITTLCLLHDIGHSPFGHAGEAALNFKMHQYGGFEGNAQTLRLVTTELEEFTEHHGLGLTRRSLLGLLKYPAPFCKIPGSFPNDNIANAAVILTDWEPKKCYYDTEIETVDWVLAPLSEEDRQHFQQIDQTGRTRCKSFDCSIMDLADDIAYSIHDLEDGIFFDLINQDEFITALEQHSQFATLNTEIHLTQLIKQLFHSQQHIRKSTAGQLIHYLIQSIAIIPQSGFADSLVKFNAVLSANARELVDIIKNFFADNVIFSRENQASVHQRALILMELFDAMIANPSKLLPESKVAHTDTHRAVCDYISGMTDDYARRLHEVL
ncbi:MAG: dGTPase [Legionellales bacterium]|nr:dGTPase [Legionellales bacterium]|tara:strand:+ start:4942 stop:6225 length:1284 start_codon:yes stop_codon:yes gene_type:complete